jgi:hypothetical protein
MFSRKRSLIMKVLRESGVCRAAVRVLLVVFTVSCFAVGLVLGLAHLAGSGRGIGIDDTRGNVLFSLHGSSLTIAAAVFVLLTAIGLWLCNRLPADTSDRRSD